MEITQILLKKMDNFCYIIGDEETGKCALVDPAFENDRILKKVEKAGYEVTHILNTHCHSDHTAGNAYIKEKTNAAICIHELDGKRLSGLINKNLTKILGGKTSPTPDILIKDKDIIKVGNIDIKVIHTPGHTPGCVVFKVEDNLFTGDTLFVGAVGRTDLAGGSSKQLKKSIRKRLYTLPDSTKVWPGHNYGITPTSTIGQEKKTNVVGP